MTRRVVTRTAVTLFFFVLAIAGTVTAQTTPGDYTDDRTLPAGVRGERIRALLEAVNAGEPAAVESLVKTAFAPEFRERVPLADHLDALLSFHDRSRGFDFYGVRRYTTGAEPDREVVIVRNRLTGGWNGITVRFDAEQRIAGLQMSPARLPKDVRRCPR